MSMQSLVCEGCGAPLPPPGGQSIARCAYCGTSVQIATETTDPDEAALAELELAESALQGLPPGPSRRRRGDGRRYGIAEMAKRDWPCVDRGIWPVAASASSSFGGGWSPKSLVGPPRVYPASGDRRGAWAPAARVSPVEWVETEYPEGPPIAAVRVFETNVPGATFAVAIRGEGPEEVVYEGPPERKGREAHVLEVRLDPPRPVRAVRAVVSNELGSSWTEIDSIGLVAATPLPVDRRANPKATRTTTRLGKVGCGALVVAAMAGAIFAHRNEAKPKTPPPAPTERVSGTIARPWAPEPERMDAHGTVWASSVDEVSSSYADTNPTSYGGAQALGPPDVYPRHFDAPRAWAAQEQDRGEEWITLRFAKPVSAGAVLVVETFHPGALARVDDLTAGRPPAVLWEGRTPAEVHSRVLRLELASPRRVDALRLILDTSRARGWNEIDAIGLEPWRDGS